MMPFSPYLFATCMRLISAAIMSVGVDREPSTHVAINHFKGYHVHPHRPSLHATWNLSVFGLAYVIGLDFVHTFVCE